MMLVHKILDCVQVAISTGQREWSVTSLVDCTWITTMLVHKILDSVQVAISTGQIEWSVTSLVDCTCKPQNCTLCWYTMIIIIVWVTAWPYYSTLVWPRIYKADFSWGTHFHLLDWGPQFPQDAWHSPASHRMHLLTEHSHLPLQLVLLDSIHKIHFPTSLWSIWSL